MAALLLTLELTSAFYLPGLAPKNFCPKDHKEEDDCKVCKSEPLPPLLKKMEMNHVWTPDLGVLWFDLSIMLAG